MCYLPNLARVRGLSPQGQKPELPLSGALTHLSEPLGIDIDAEELPYLAVLHKAQAVFHLHVVGLEHAHQHQRTFRIDRWLVRRIAVRADGAFEKQLVGPERRKRRREFCAVICD